MTRRELIDYCLTYPDAFEDYPFHDGPKDGGSWTVMRHRLNKKGFAFIFEREGLCVNLKCEPLRADFLRRLYQGVTPAYHMNKVHWNTVRIGSDVPEDALFDMIEHSYQLTSAKHGKP
jgi:predicted DNA-binding protein (MmcQ/YjbR family)